MPDQDPAVQRARKRLAVLGIDPDAGLDEIKAWYETERARYLHLAENGLHMAPGHGIYGMAIEALKGAHGWADLPDDWSPAQVHWPTMAERANGATGR